MTTTDEYCPAKALERFSPGDTVWYAPTWEGDNLFAAVIEHPAYKLASGHVVVCINSLPAEYQLYTGSPRTRLTAAFTKHLFARDPQDARGSIPWGAQWKKGRAA
jgi:hypothetical protein